MEHHDHNHDHEIGGCACGHDHEETATQQAAMPMDAASESLSNALRMSFWILSVVMVIVFVGFLCTGFSCASTNKVVVTKCLGKVTGVSERRGGLVVNWPYPIGESQVVYTGPQDLKIQDFARTVTPQETAAATEEQKRQIASPDIKPGIDGALLTGDHNLLHAIFTCRYQIENPMGYLEHLADRTRRLTDDQPDPMLAQLVRNAVCRATIRLAATRTAGSIYANPNLFFSDVRAAAQEELENQLPRDRGGRIVVISSISGSAEWPVMTWGATVALSKATMNYQGKIDTAKKEAIGALRAAAGSKYDLLVGDLLNPQRPVIGAQTNLIGQYSQVREQLSQARLAKADAQKRRDAAAAAAQDKLIAQHTEQAESLLKLIDNALSKDITEGQVSDIMTKAERDKANFLADIKTRENAFRLALERYNASPELLLQERWAAVRDEILQSEQVGKMYLTLGEGKTTLYINLDPKITKAINQAILKAEKDKDSKNQQGHR